MLLSVGEAITVSLSKEFFLFLENNETTFIHSLAQRTNQETSSLTKASHYMRFMSIFSGAEKRTKRNIHPH